MVGNSITVLLTAIPLVPGKTVYREEPVIGNHDAVADNLGNNRGSCGAGERRATARDIPFNVACRMLI
jgi:hypothetical protein